MKELSKVQFSKFLQVPSAGGGETLKASETISISFEASERMVFVTATNPADGVVSRRLVPLENVMMMELMEDFETSNEQREISGRKSKKESTKGSKGNPGVDVKAKGTGGRGRPKAKG